MGCDIHLTVEKKIDGEWKETEGDFHQRNHTLFSVLAGVRNDHGIIPISKPKGKPLRPKIELETDDDYEFGFWSTEEGYSSGDFHSHSWLTLKEICDYDWNQINPKRYVEGGTLKDYCSYFLDFIEDLKNRTDNLEDMRIVFYFDN